jgi:hypothetical protein
MWRQAMNGVHDLGGIHGFGPVEREADEPLFHAEGVISAEDMNTPKCCLFSLLH